MFVNFSKLMICGSMTYVTKPFLVFSKWGSRCLRLLRYQGTKAGNPCNAIPT